VVIYQHGLLDCCAGILCKEESSLGIRLVNRGYDLWLANSRGNRYSKNHVELADEEPRDEEYWKFSFSEMATYD